MIKRKPDAPLFRDPIYDGATDPVVIWNKNEQNWWMLYTQRRASAPGIGVSWVHGSKIGVASSKDGGKSWLYRGTLNNLDFEAGHNTFWAPEIIYNEGTYHMYVSYIKGIPVSWNYPRSIIHYTSENLWDWQYESKIQLSSNRVIDAGIVKLESGIWRMWYKDEDNNSASYYADSKDLYNWEVQGKAVDVVEHEGPNVFFYKNKYWMICDFWKGLMVLSSEDATEWIRQEDILTKTGIRKDDKGYGHHADIVVEGEKAYIFYFTHPEKVSRRSSIQVALLEIQDGEMICNRDKEFQIMLREKD